jgi:hypothetical protein
MLGDVELFSYMARSPRRIYNQGLTNLTLGVPLCYFDSPRSRPITAVKNSPRIIHGREDQSVVKNHAQNSMLISKPINFVLRNRQLTPPCSFAVVDTSSPGAK